MKRKRSRSKKPQCPRTISDLPLETLIQIFCFLHPRDVWRLRSLGQIFNTFICTAHFATLNIHHWVSTTLTPVSSNSNNKKFPISALLDDMFLNRNWNSHFKTEYAKQLSATKPQITAFINWDLIPSDSILWCEPFSRRSNEIPVQINLLKDIQFLDLGSCSLSGEIPDSLWSSDFKNLQHITLSNNTLTGVISPLIANFAATLEALDLGANNLSGCIPSVVGSLKHLSELYLKSNNLHGSLPHEIGLLEQLVYLDVSNNRLSGPLPHSLFHCSKLVHLKIACNDFCGEVSGRVGNLFELEVLSAFSNQFVGCIPSEIGRLELLSELYLNDNSLTGQIPKELCDLRFLEICDLTGNIDLTCDFESFEALQF